MTLIFAKKFMLNANQTIIKNITLSYQLGKEFRNPSGSSCNSYAVYHQKTMLQGIVIQI